MAGTGEARLHLAYTQTAIRIRSASTPRKVLARLMIVCDMALVW